MSEQKNNDAFAVLDQLRAINQEENKLPRFAPCPVKIGGEKLRFRRLHFAQLLAMKDRLRNVGYKLAGTITAKQRGELLHLVQISLVPQGDSGLRFPGVEGRSRLSLLLEPQHVDALGQSLVVWNEIFDEAETESTPSPVPVVSSDPPSA